MPAGDLASPGTGARIWEAGWLGSPTRGAAWARGLIVLVLTVGALAGGAALWAHTTYAGAAAMLDVVPAVVVSSIALIALVYWLHGSFGQAFLFLFAALFTALVGGYALGGAVLTARGISTPAVIDGCTRHTDLRTSWVSCAVSLPDGTRLGRPLRSDGDRRPGERVIVTYDPGGFVAPAYGDHTGPHPALPVAACAGLLLTAGCVVAAIASGERHRLRGEPAIAQRFNPHYYPRRAAAAAQRARDGA
jgi:hypothetical protein